MPALPLKLRIAPLPLPVCAGWLPCAGVFAWLEEARRIEEAVPGAVIRFYPLAASAQDQSVAGVVITVSSGPPELDRVLGPQVQRLGEVAPGVLVPVQARLEPALTVAEWGRLFPWPLHFFHPAMGLTGFEERDALEPWQLLSAPLLEQGRWFAAVPGPEAPLPLRQITLVQELSLEELIAEGAGDISSQRPDKNAPLPDAGLPGKAGGYAAGMLGALGAGLLGALGQGKAAAAMERWSRRQQEDLQDRRKRELNKLLDRFDKGDILDALRHAIPLSGAEARRGQAPTPGWKLGMRNPGLTAFSQGGGAVDVWNIASGTRLKLEKRYREAAAREAAAGQWGRAVFIYGELLGDWNRAAEMLENGGRPREAARIYTERLGSGLRAAQCLEKAGLLAEAAALYQEAGQPEKAGDLFAALGQETIARQQWEAAADSLTNPLEQARLLESKLQDPDRALLALQSGWPAAGRALPCFEAWISLMGRLGRHAGVAACLDQLEKSPSQRLQPASTMVSGLQTIFAHYPDSSLRDQAAALAPLLIGEALATAPGRAESERLLTLLPRFAPGDRLLARDAGRFALTKHRPVVPLLEQPQATVLRADRVIPLDPTVKWQSLTDSPHGPHVAGWQPSGPSVRVVAGAILQGQAPGQNSRLKFRGPDPRLRHLVRLSGPYCAAFYSRAHLQVEFDLLSGVPGSSVSVLAVGKSAQEEMVLLSRTRTGTLTAEYVGSQGEIRRSRVLDFAPPGMEAADWFTGGHGADLWLAGMEVVCCITESNEFQHIAINGPVTAFAIAPPVLPSQAVAVGAGDAVLLIAKGKGKPVDCVNLYSGSAVQPPVVAFTGDGRAVIADGQGGIVYHLRGGLRKQADIVIPPGSGELVAAAGIGAQGFAFLTSTGKVLGYGV